MRGAGSFALIFVLIGMCAMCSVDMHPNVAWADDIPAPESPLDDVGELAAAINASVSAQWSSEGITPAPACDNVEFLRRTYLNLVGRIPSVSETRGFLADESPGKRRVLVDRLLESPIFVANLTNIYRTLMLPEADADFQIRFLVPGFEAWLRDKLIDETPYDQMVRELVTYTLTGNDRTGPSAFYRAKQLKPENLAAGTTRLFLGVRLECAQCHDHPFAKWRQDEFWSFAAFYAGFGDQQTGQMAEDPRIRRIAVPETERVVAAKFLGGDEPEWTPRSFPRNVLADWLTSPENPYFARAAANRIWAHMMGRGLVDPVDDFDESNPPSHPKLLDELASQFVAHDFDIKFLFRAIAASKPYQLSSRQTHDSQADARLFSRMTVKGLSPDQLFDSLAQATGFYENTEFSSRSAAMRNDGSMRSRFRELFRNENSDATESQTTILQALALMNGTFVGSQTDPVQSSTLSAVIASPFLDLPGKVETLFLASLNREPTSDELKNMLAHIEQYESASAEEKSDDEPARALLPASAGRPDSQAAALGDIFWALLNSNEFLVNH